MDVNFIKNKAHQLSILLVKLHDLSSRKCIGIHLNIWRNKFLECIKNEEVCLSFTCIAQDVDGFVCFGLMLYYIIVQIRFQEVFNGNAIVLTGRDDVREEWGILGPAHIFFQEFNGFRKSFKIFDQWFGELVFVLACIQFASYFRHLFTDHLNRFL